MARRSNSLGRGIGARLREARRLRERTLRDLADEVGVSPTTLVTIERGDGGNTGVGLLTDRAGAGRAALLARGGRRHNGTHRRLSSASDRKRRVRSETV